MQWLLFTISFLPTYVPQILSLALPVWIIAVGVVGVILSLIATAMFLQTTYKPMMSQIRNRWTRLLYAFSMLALMIKSVLEVGGAIPSMADLIIHNRQVVIGYLHLTLLGFISSYLLFAIYHYLLKNPRYVQVVSIVFTSATLLMVVTLFLDGLLRWLQIQSDGQLLNLWLALISAIIVCSGIPVLVNLFKWQK
jgi:hypothetical protein